MVIMVLDFNSFFLIAQVFLSEIYSWMCYFYIIKGKNWATTNLQPTSEASYKKKLPMDYNNVQSLV